ncbi:TetR/AcrR family transcriptional regulator [Paraconexibacter antarcticus]|uniref:TetR/AcrR family transcriptional regulator n=1 Tax=Paraconexibacter antarcticus TaxID=2949664 RepID=A0ABY5DYK4_9ACTN|nr:TetR/AcrR family transcriptional regulator [Paraconexibacter antarcticus]UTI66761.1 TetR/AcrR family transcriptional regulator [Paraconexibacter antarcticus]
MTPQTGSPHQSPPRLTPKGDRRAASILQAATTVLARDGFGGATLGRIAAEASAEKRSVLYYFGTRERLLVKVVHDLGARIAETVRQTTPHPEDPRALLDAIVSTTWDGVTSDPQLVRAYFALVAGDVEAGEVDDALNTIKDLYRTLIREQLLALQAAGWTLRGDLHVSASALFALLRGYLLQWLEEGESALTEGGLDQFKALMAAQFHPYE